MAVSKVQKSNGDVLIDLTSDTVTPSALMTGYTAHDKTGTLITGTASGGSGDGYVWQDAEGYIHLSDEEGTSISVEPLSVTQNGTYTAPTGKAYSPVTVNVSGSGGGDQWNWMGRNPVKIKTFTSEHSSFNDLDFGTWTWSTSSSVLRNKEAYIDTVDIDCGNYDYLIIASNLISFSYGDWAMANASERIGYFSAVGIVGSYITGAYSLVTPNTITSLTICSKLYYRYKDSGGATRINENNGYGLYSSLPSYTLISGSGVTRSINVNKPVINVRGNASYYSSTAHENIDMGNSFYDLEMELWRVDNGTSTVRFAIDNAADIINNGL